MLSLHRCDQYDCCDLILFMAQISVNRNAHCFHTNVRHKLSYQLDLHLDKFSLPHC